MEILTQISKSGRITIPAKMRTALGIQPGDLILVKLENGTVHVIPLKQAVHMAQRTVRQYVPEGISLVEELIWERREESASE